MRAARLLQILLLLQNRGRMTSAELSREVEVTQRTILRDVDGMTEAGLPIIVHRGSMGGIELGFNYRTRLTGLAADEAEALGVLLSSVGPVASALGIEVATRRATAKLVESFPDGVRERIDMAMSRFRFQTTLRCDADPRLPALVRAVRDGRIVRINARARTPRTIHPTSLVLGDDGWSVVDGHDVEHPIPLRDCGDINISAGSFRSV
ncbi:MAG: hypothetical protein RLZ98_3775 [Pseudomonadota bacterium]